MPRDVVTLGARQATQDMSETQLHLSFFPKTIKIKFMEEKT